MREGSHRGGQPSRRTRDEYDNRSRSHRSLDGNAPEPPAVEHYDGSVYAIPHLRGLHHEYRRAG